MRRQSAFEDGFDNALSSRKFEVLTFVRAVAQLMESVLSGFSVGSAASRQTAVIVLWSVPGVSADPSFVNHGGVVV